MASRYTDDVLISILKYVHVGNNTPGHQTWLLVCTASHQLTRLIQCRFTFLPGDIYHVPPHTLVKLLDNNFELRRMNHLEEIVNLVIDRFIIFGFDRNARSNANLAWQLLKAFPPLRT